MFYCIIMDSPKFRYHLWRGGGGGVVSCEHKTITNFVPKQNKTRGHKVVSWLKGKMKAKMKNPED